MPAGTARTIIAKAKLAKRNLTKTMKKSPLAWGEGPFCAALRVQKAELRRGPGMEHERMCVLDQAAGWPLIVVRQSRNNWVLVRDLTGLSGWLKRARITRKPYIVTLSQIAGRTRPEISAPIMAHLGPGVRAQRLDQENLGQSGAWVLIYIASHKIKMWIPQNSCWPNTPQDPPVDGAKLRALQAVWGPSTSNESAPANSAQPATHESAVGLKNGPNPGTLPRGRALANSDESFDASDSSTPSNSPRAISVPGRSHRSDPRLFQRSRGPKNPSSSASRLPTRPHQDFPTLAPRSL